MYLINKLFFGLFLVLLISNVSASTMLLSVDIVTDDLVRINASTGTTIVVGALGKDVADIDLARTADGRLWGLNSVYGSRVDLWQINPLTGAVINSVQVRDASGNAIRSAEGLGSNGDQLSIGYSLAGDSNSNTFANLSTAGAISDPMGVNIDIDGLSIGASSIPFFAVDREPSSASSLYTLNPPTGTILGSAFDPNTFFFNDIMPTGELLYVIDNGSSVLYEMHQKSGALERTIDLSRHGTYLGLANATIPIPPALLLFGSGLLGLIGISRRKKTA